MVAFALPLILILLGGTVMYFLPQQTHNIILSTVTANAIPIGVVILVVITIILLYFYMR